MSAVNEQNEDLAERKQPPNTEPSEVTIYIDRSAFRIPHHALTGYALRELATPTIRSDYELFCIVPGGDDLVVRDEEVVKLDDGAQFFSAPRMIMAGTQGTLRTL
jgi:hypothetical protein